MPRRKNSVPAYSFHRPSGQAYVRVPDGTGGRKTVYLGAYDSAKSRQEYARVVAELAAAPAVARPPAPTPAGGHIVTVNDLLLAFWRFAERHYRRADGSATDELAQYRQTFRLVKELYGRTPAADFGPRALKALRQKMIQAGWTRKLINQRVGRVRRVFKWAASEELIAAGVYQALTTVTGLQAGRTEARETDPVEPVAEEHVRAALPFLLPEVRAMVRVQLLTGMRPGEVTQLRPCDIDTTGDVWLFRPVQYKTRHRNKPRVVAIGPKAQAVLAAFTPPDPADYYFSPRRAVERMHAERTAVRKTPRYASHLARNTAKRAATPKRRPAERYTVMSYGYALRRAVVKANARREQMAGAGNYDAVPAWHPNQLRHAHGTAVRHRYGLEAAQVALGHERADVTQVYAEKNLALAVKVAAEIG
jgi:integrase